MHFAFDLNQLLKLTLPIECIAAFDDYLFVGTRVGHLLIYSVTKKPGDLKPEVMLLSYNKHFSKKPVVQLDVIPAYQGIVSLSDNIISYHNVYQVTSQTSSTIMNATALEKTKGATLFTIELSNETSLTGKVACLAKMVVVVKRKLQFYYLKKGAFYELQSEVALPEVPKAILSCNNTVVLGYKSEYWLYSLTEKKFENLVPVGGASTPLITRIEKDVFGLGKDSQSILMNSAGKLQLQYAAKWGEFPLAVVYDKPYLIGVLSEAVEVRTIEPNQFIQNTSCSKATMATRAKSGIIYIANSSQVWCLQAVPVPQQIKSLLQEKQFELALKLAKECDVECEEDQKKNVHDIQTLYAHHLFKAKQYKESMEQFTSLGTDPCEVIKLYPDLLPPSSPRPPQPKLTDREVEQALTALMDYLTEVRRDVSNNNTRLSMIDTTLLKCYLQFNDAMVAPVLRLNKVNFAEAERVLKKHNKISELQILYRTNGLHSQALALLKQLDNLPAMVDYLQHLGADNVPLLLEYAEWAIAKNPKYSLSIFIEDTKEVEMLPRPQILNFLLNHCKSLAIPYLEHCIKVWEDTNTILHTTMANLYLEKYQSLQSQPETKQEALKLREQLRQFLESSDSYTPQTVLNIFPKDDMLEERAIILGKQGRHEQALAIYVCLLEDVEKAKQYCERVAASKAPGHDEVYLLLMRILISPPENWLMGASPPAVNPRDIATAIEVLKSNPEKINPVQALSILPDDVPLNEIREYLESNMRSRLVTRHHTQLLKGLVYSEHLQVQKQRMRTEARPIVVTEQHNCVVCAKRFTNQSVVALIPKGLVHYGCLKEEN